VRLAAKALGAIPAGAPLHVDLCAIVNHSAIVTASSTPEQRT
jgi:hypothetical protein